MKQKVIFVTKALWIGGIESSLVNLLNAFNYEKYDVTLLITKAELNLKDKINKNVKLLIIDREETYSFDNRYRFKSLYHLTEESSNPSFIHKLMMWSVPLIEFVENKLYIKYVKELMRDQVFDTAIIYSDVVGELTIKAIRAKKYLMYYHHGAMRHVYHDKIAYKKCQKIIAVSNNQARLLKQFIPKYADKVVVIHNLVNVKSVIEKSKMPIKERFEKDKFNIVTVGRVSHEKGIDIAVRVCAKLVDNGYKNIQWWLVGDGPAMQEVKDVIKETHMENHIKLLGMKDNPYPYTRKADLYVQPSRFESFGLTILEALILNRIILTTKTLGATEVTKNNRKVFLAKCKIDSLVNELEYIIKNKSRIDSIPSENIGEQSNINNIKALKKLEMYIGG